MPDCGQTGRVYLEDVWSRLFHDMCEAEQVKQGFSHKAFPLAVAPQRLTDLRLVCFSGYLRERKHINNTLLYLTVCILGDSGGQNMQIGHLFKGVIFFLCKVSTKELRLFTNRRLGNKLIHHIKHKFRILTLTKYIKKKISGHKLLLEIVMFGDVCEKHNATGHTEVTRTV